MREKQPFLRELLKSVYSVEQVERLLNELPHISMLLDHSKRLKVSSQEVDSLEWVGKVLCWITFDVVVGFLGQESESNTKKQKILGNLSNSLFIRNFMGDPVSDNIPSWLTEISEKIHPVVQSAIGYIFSENKFYNILENKFYNKDDAKANKDDMKAIFWLTLAANNGDVNAQLNLGRAYA